MWLVLRPDQAQRLSWRICGVEDTHEYKSTRPNGPKELPPLWISVLLSDFVLLSDVLITTAKCFWLTGLISDVCVNICYS